MSSRPDTRFTIIGTKSWKPRSVFYRGTHKNEHLRTLTRLHTHPLYDVLCFEDVLAVKFGFSVQQNRRQLVMERSQINERHKTRWRANEPNKPAGNESHVEFVRILIKNFLLKLLFEIIVQPRVQPGLLPVPNDNYYYRLDRASRYNFQWHTCEVFRFFGEGVKRFNTVFKEFFAKLFEI